MNRRIEAGCLCLIKTGGAAGSQCVAINFMKAGCICEFKGNTYRNPSDRDAWMIELLDGRIGLYEARHLLRIDDYNEETETQEEECEV